MSILIKNGYVITGDNENREYDNADLLMRDDRIVAVGPGIAEMPEAKAPNIEVIDGSGAIVMGERKILTIDEEVLKEEIREAAERFVRDYLPPMQRGAERLGPYLRQLHFDTAERSVPAGSIPLRRPPIETS